MASLSFIGLSSTSLKVCATDIPGDGKRRVIIEADTNNGSYEEHLNEVIEDGEATSSWATVSQLDATGVYKFVCTIYDTDGYEIETVSESIVPEDYYESGSTEWSVAYKKTIPNINDIVQETYNLNEYSLIRWTITFAESGEVLFYSSGASDSYGSLSATNNFNPGTGAAYDELAYNENKSGDFEFTYNVTAGATYCFFASHYHGDSAGEFTITIEPSTAASSGPDMSGVCIVEREPDDPTTELAVRVEGLDESYDDTWELTWYLYEDAGFSTKLQEGTDSRSGGYTYSKTYTFTGLKPNTQYYVVVKIEYFDGDILTEGYWHSTNDNAEGDFRTSGVGRPVQFSWATPKTKGQSFKLTASEWCDLLDNINSVKEYLGLTPVGTTDNTDALAYFYYPSKGDNILASMYNQIIYCYDDMGLLRYIDNFVSPKDPITADKLNLLMNTINDVE